MVDEFAKYAKADAKSSVEAEITNQVSYCSKYGEAA